MKSTLLAPVVVLLALPCSPGWGRPPQDAARPSVAGEEEKALRAAAEAFAKAFEKGDEKGIAALFSEGAEALDHEGAAIRGRDAIAQHYRGRFADAPGDKLEVVIESIHLLAPGVAGLEGRSRLHPNDGQAATSSRFSTVYAKVDGRWLIASVREREDAAPTPHERLKDLEWLVGDWVQEGGDSVILNSVKWSEDENFLIRSFDIRAQGRGEISGTQRIGWDPLSGQFKSWAFDSHGGHAEAAWIRKGNEWIVKSSGVRPDGLVATATQVITRENKHRIRWKSIDRTLGDSAVEDIAEIVMVRKPPQPR